MTTMYFSSLFSCANVRIHATISVVAQTIKPKSIGIALITTVISACTSNPGSIRAFSPISSPTNKDSPISYVIRNGASLVEQCINTAQDDKALAPVCKESVLYEKNNNSLGDAFLTCTNTDISCSTARNQFIDLAVKVADNNCTEFREQLFAKRAGANIFTGLLRDSASVGGAVTAVASPATSIGLNLSGLLIGSYEKVNQELFSNKTAQIFDKAIDQAMLNYYTDTVVNNCKKSYYGDCSIHRAINIVKQYTGRCSIRAALLTIEEALQTNKDTKQVVETTAREEAIKTINATVRDVAKTEVNSALTNNQSNISQQSSVAKTAADSAQNSQKEAAKAALSAQESANLAIEKFTQLCTALKSASGVSTSVSNVCQ